MKTLGAQYVIYENSGFLAESVWRIYPLVDKIVFLVGQSPWNGERNPAIINTSLTEITSMPDPDKKFVILSKYWATEADQRNDGVKTLRELGCEWCLVIDDDEMYNRQDLVKAKNIISTWVCTNGDVGAWLVSHVIYWKNRYTVIDQITPAMPVFVRTREDDIVFTEARCFYPHKSVFMVFPPHDILLHHFSYIRTDQQMSRKLAHFSHAKEVSGDWFTDVWLNWTPEMENLHPNRAAPQSFKRAVRLADFSYALEEKPLSLTNI